MKQWYALYVFLYYYREYMFRFTFASRDRPRTHLAAALNGCEIESLFKFCNGILINRAKYEKYIYCCDNVIDDVIVWLRKFANFNSTNCWQASDNSMCHILVLVQSSTFKYHALSFNKSISNPLFNIYFQCLIDCDHDCQFVTEWCC